MSEAVLQAIDLEKEFIHWQGFLGFLNPKAMPALNRVSLSFHRGEITGLTGANGAGKTTLLKLLAGLILPTGGKVLLDGQNVAGLGSKIRARVGIAIAESRSFYWRLTCRQNLEFFATLHGLAGVAREKRLAAAVEKMGLGERLDDKFFTLSSGLMQRMALARTMLGDPEVWLFDEPTRDVDEQYSAVLFTELQRLKKEGRCIVLVGHDRQELETQTDRLIVMVRGEVTG